MAAHNEFYTLIEPTGAQVFITYAPDRVVLVLGIRGDARAIIAPPALERESGERVAGRWIALDPDPADVQALLAQGVIEHDAGTIEATVRFSFAQTDAPIQPLLLAWRLRFTGGACAGAIRWAVHLPDVPHDPTLLDLPSIHYGRVSYGSGLYPHPDPRHGFAFRADRVAQVALHYSAPTVTWSVFTASETPDPPLAEQIYALGMEPTTSDPNGLAVVLRYPQEEYGHRGDGSAEAYVAKDTFAQGERASLVFAAESTLSDTLFVLARPSSAAHDAAAVMRYLWQSGAPSQQPTTHSLLRHVGLHVQWFNRRLFNPQIGGGQYESPEGSGTAMLGFVEQSLMMASVTLRYALLHGVEQGHIGDELLRHSQHAIGALTRWATFGLSQEGLLYPACDRSGYHFGARQYSDYEQLTISNDDSFDTIRVATEARSLIAAAYSARQQPGLYQDDVRLWLSAARSVADWLRQHPLPGGGYAGRYSRSGQPVDDDPAGTAAAIGLFCDCARLLAVDAPADAAAYREAALTAFETVLAESCRQGIFTGGTLDASCPDREAAIASLDACMTLYELTDDEHFLTIAAAAADNILSYTLVYDITTFAVDSDASRRRVAMRGAMIVSPENQHLDPVPSTPALLLYGLYTGDQVAIDAAITSLHWTLDGRWAHSEPDGLKQSEQMLHTRWYYNDFFTRRGDVRTGMPLWGRSDSEHGWPQVVPSSSMLGTGQVLVDWRSGRAVAVESFVITEIVAGERSLRLRLTPVADQPTALLLRVVRLPSDATLLLRVGSRSIVVTADMAGMGYLLSLSQATPIDLDLSLADNRS